MKSPSFITFYAYKGGTGRTMALAHTALHLAHGGHRVVAVDLDLEAPSLWPLLGGAQALAPVPGVVELMNAWLHGRSPRVTEYLRPIALSSRARGNLFVISAGMMDASYLRSLETLDWSRLAAATATSPQTELFPRTHFFDALKRELQGTATVVLLDAPTGLNDTANVCLRLASDVVVAIFAAHRVQLEGVARVIGALVEEQTIRRRQGQPMHPEVFGVVSTVTSHRPSGALHRRVQSAFDYLARVRYEAMGSPPMTEEISAAIEQAPAIIGYDPALSDLEQIDTTTPIDGIGGPYHDLIELLASQAPPPSPEPPSPRLSGAEKRRIIDELAPHMEIFANRSHGNPTSFLRASHLIDVGRPLVVVVLGGKGAGKTELFNHCIMERPAHASLHVPVHGTQQSAMSSDALVHLMQRARPDVVWRAYCIAQLPEDLTSSLSGVVGTAIAALRALLRSSTGVDHAVEALTRNELDVELHAAWKHIDEADPAKSLALYVDGLDTSFKDDLAVRSRALQGLFVGWQASFNGLRTIALKIFLRTDLWESLSFPEKSHLQTRTLQLVWDEPNLWRMVLKRALQSEGFRALCHSCGVDPVLSPDQVEQAPHETLNHHMDALVEQRIWSGKNSLTRNWMIRRLTDAKSTVYPRDVLCLIKESMRLEGDRIQEQKRLSPDAVLSREAVADSLLPTSELRVEAVREEYQELIDVLPRLRGAPAKGPIRDLRPLLEPDVDRQLERLVRAGILEARGDDYSVPPLYLHGLGMARLGPR